MQQATITMADIAKQLDIVGLAQTIAEVERAKYNQMMAQYRIQENAPIGSVLDVQHGFVMPPQIEEKGGI